MKQLDYVLVVEGKSDVSFLQNFLAPIEFITTNGSDIPSSTLDYLEHLSHTYEIVLLTDPDSPGKRIRDIIAERIPNVQHAFVEKKYAIKKKKVGVAESDPEHILIALEHCIGKKVEKKDVWTLDDLFELGLTGTEKSKKIRESLMEHFHLGYGNAKTLLKRLNSSSIKKSELIEFLKKEKV